MNDHSVLLYLFQLSYTLDNSVASQVLQLLQAALCPAKNEKQPSRSKSSSPEKSVRKDKAKSEDPDDEGSGCASDGSLCVALVQQLARHISIPKAGHPKSILYNFVEKFLLECNITSIRWQAHTLVLALYNSMLELEDKKYLLDTMWNLWRLVPEHGRRAVQFVDLLGFFTVSECSSEKNGGTAEYARAAVQLLRSQNAVLSSHANSSIYTSLSQLVDFSGTHMYHIMHKNATNTLGRMTRT